ncbi:DUF3899 domain-containing protein [Halobacillus amylolyticus]|uniref:DUF3899 domain-containing protein n=1 Tax=Halobacillus amylolyticus TaxID=2932259 RepID=A0ABY4HEB7_9BACI|nr:DUF3899 domain-containing protein [Halobacillus amylolyticus]UOR13131.1 DUF3899 domain-containing protein [Halobacillus amylolyticus]
MAIVRSKWTIVILNFFLCILLFVFWAPAQDLLNFINLLFYIAYVYLFIGLILWVVRGGFFDGITYSMRRFTNRMSKNKDYLDEWEDRPLPSEMVHRSWSRFFMFQGVILCIGLAALLAVYYN